MHDAFQALVLTEQEGRTLVGLRQLHTDDLPPGEVLIAVRCSSLNYKDALAVTGRGKVVRRFPMVPGVDLAGVVQSSASPALSPGDPVLVTGWGVGETHWGGYAQRARVAAGWITRLPGGLSLEQAMAIGTAGLTAMLCVMALEDRGLSPGQGPVIVTGASGGVGGIAVALLAHLGYQVLAVTGRLSMHDYLRGLGAAGLVDRETLGAPARPLESEAWAGAIDTAGGPVLAGVLSRLRYGAAVAACGLAGGAELHTTVFPFILRGVSLLGIDSVRCPAERRDAAWQRLARELPSDLLARMTRRVPLDQVPETARDLLEGRLHGRVVVEV